MNHVEMFESLRSAGNITVRYKSESGLMKVIGALMFFNRQFMTHVTTTLGSTVYFPSREYVETDPAIAWDILAHELVHVMDYKRNRLFMVLYSLPQLLAVLALLAIPLHSWWPLLFLLCLAPLPAPWRLNSELRGYAMGMAVWHWYRKAGIPQAMKADIVANLTGPLYYFTWWVSRAHVEARVNAWSKRILLNDVDSDPVFKLVHDAIKSQQTPRQH